MSRVYFTTTFQHNSFPIPTSSIETNDHTGGGYEIGGLHPTSIAALLGKGPDIKPGERFDLKFNVNKKRTSLSLVVFTMKHLPHVEWSSNGGMGRLPLSGLGALATQFIKGQKKTDRTTPKKTQGRLITGRGDRRPQELKMDSGRSGSEKSRHPRLLPAQVGDGSGSTTSGKSRSRAGGGYHQRAAKPRGSRNNDPHSSPRNNTSRTPGGRSSERSYTTSSDRLRGGRVEGTSSGGGGREAERRKKNQGQDWDSGYASSAASSSSGRHSAYSSRSPSKRRMEGKRR